MKKEDEGYPQRCYDCEELTGKDRRGDSSLYYDFSFEDVENIIGPLCQRCYFKYAGEE